MMMDWASVSEIYTKFFGQSYLFIIYAICLIYILIFCPGYRKTLGFGSAAMAAVLLNPISVSVLSDKFSGDTYWRTLWLLPIIPVLAVAFTDIIRRMKNKALKIAAGILCVLILIINGQCVYNKNVFIKEENSYKLPQAAVDISDYLLSIEDEPRAIVPRSLFCYIRQYTTKIRLMYGRDADGYVSAELTSDNARIVHEQLMSGQPDVELVAEIAQDEDYHFIVFPQESVIDQGILESYHYEQTAEIDGYYIYYWNK